MRITGIKVEKVTIPLIAPFKVAFATVEALESGLIRVETDEGCVGFGEASPFAPVTGETLDGVIAVLDIFRQGLIGMAPMDIEAVHAMMDSVIVGNGAAKCAVDLAMYDLMGKAFGQPVYKLLGGFGSSVQSDITIGISTPEDMAAEAKKRVFEDGYRILKIKAGIDCQEDIRAMKLIREAVGPEIRLRVDANQGYDTAKAQRALRGFREYGIEAVEQCLPHWDLEGAAYLRDHSEGIHMMLDESIHGPVDAARACRLGSADIFNIKLMKCGGLYPAQKINAIAEANGVTCMVGCMLETKLAITAGLSLVAAKKNVTEADCDSFLYYKENPVEGGFTQEKDLFTLLDQPGFGVTF
ncbi:MAG: dipeptide epimerase [Schaedlerella sp.]|uniref:mandelate racemase/muconate lactonizing enzyme family protein n=1 Tax=Schaedlerella sp. TaxID=2676057 RepID=UPI0035286394